MLVIEGDSKSQCRGRTFAREWLNRRAVSASCAEPFEPAPVVVVSTVVLLLLCGLGGFCVMVWSGLWSGSV